MDTSIKHRKQDSAMARPFATENNLRQNLFLFFFCPIVANIVSIHKVSVSFTRSVVNIFCAIEKQGREGVGLWEVGETGVCVVEYRRGRGGRRAGGYLRVMVLPWAIGGGALPPLLTSEDSVTVGCQHLFLRPTVSPRSRTQQPCQSSHRGERRDEHQTSGHSGEIPGN